MVSISSKMGSTTLTFVFCCALGFTQGSTGTPGTSPAPTVSSGVSDIATNAKTTTTAMVPTTAAPTEPKELAPGSITFLLHYQSTGKIFTCGAAMLTGVDNYTLVMDVTGMEEDELAKKHAQVMFTWPYISVQGTENKTCVVTFGACQDADAQCDCYENKARLVLEAQMHIKGSRVVVTSPHAPPGIVATFRVPEIKATCMDPMRGSSSDGISHTRNVKPNLIIFVTMLTVVMA